VKTKATISNRLRENEAIHGRRRGGGRRAKAAERAAASIIATYIASGHRPVLTKKPDDVSGIKVIGRPYAPQTSAGI